MTIAVDFDGTIVTHAYPEIGKPIPFAVDTLRKLAEEGHDIILWSCREGQLLQDAVDYCHQRGLDFYAINSNFPEENSLQDGLTARKLTADLFIDDRNLGGLPDWGIIYRMVHNNNCFKPWHDSNAPSDTKKASFWTNLFG